MNSEKKTGFTDGIFKNNPVFAGGVLLAPALVIGNTLTGASVYGLVFSAVTFTSLMLCSFIPRNIHYALRIVLYTLCGAGVYIPVHMLTDKFLPGALGGMGALLPMIAAGEIMTSYTETKFFTMKRGRMTLDIISHIIGFDIAIVLLGTVRELFSAGGLFGEIYGISLRIPFLSAPCGGFILIGLAAALVRLMGRGRACL